MSIGSGLAVAAIWAAVGVIGWHDPGAGFATSIFGLIASTVIVGRS